MTNFKMLPLAVALTAISAGASAMEAMDDASMDAMTGQAGITIEASLQANIGSATYTDTGSITAEGIAIGGSIDTSGSVLKADSSLSLTQTVDVIDNYNSTGEEAIALGVTGLNADIGITALKIGENSAGQVIIRNLALEDSTTYIRAGGSAGDGLTVDANLQATVGTLTYTDTDADGSSIVVGDVRVGEIATTAVTSGPAADQHAVGDLIGGVAITQTVDVVTGYNHDNDSALLADGLTANPNFTASVDAVKLGITDMTVDLSVGSIKLGDASGDSIGSIAVQDLNLAGSDTYIVAGGASGSGLTINSTMKVAVASATYTDQGSISARDIAINGGFANNVKVKSGVYYTLNTAGTEYFATNAATGEQTGSGIAVATVNTDGTYATQTGITTYEERALGTALQLNGQTIDVVQNKAYSHGGSGDAIVIGAPTVQGNIYIGAIDIGTRSIGSVSFSNLDLAGSTTTIYAH